MKKEQMEDKRVKVLLIEDNPGDARLIREMLKVNTKTQFELTHTERLNEGLERFSNNKFDVLLLDLGLPDCQGLDTLKEVNLKKPDEPIVVLTGFADELVGIQAVHSGAQDYLIKGEVDSKLLIRSINYAIERKRAEEEKEKMRSQLLQAQKMEAVGRLAGGVAHDFNNLLTVIIGYTELLLNDFHLGDPRRKDVQDILNAGREASLITRQLLAFSRKQVIQPQDLNINTVVTDIEKMLKHLIGEDINLVILTEQKLGLVKADPGQMKQVIINLVVNAHEAMPEGGKLTIKTENVTLNEEDCILIPESRPGKFVRLSILDTGSGMDKETVTDIFEPFFTTKGTGTGLGLSVVYGIVKQHKGWMEVQSSPGKGSTFKVYLPLSPLKEKIKLKIRF